MTTRLASGSRHSQFLTTVPNHHAGDNRAATCLYLHRDHIHLSSLGGSKLDVTASQRHNAQSSRECRFSPNMIADDLLAQSQNPLYGLNSHLLNGHNLQVLLDAETWIGCHLSAPQVPKSQSSGTLHHIWVQALRFTSLLAFERPHTTPSKTATSERHTNAFTKSVCTISYSCTTWPLKKSPQHGT